MVVRANRKVHLVLLVNVDQDFKDLLVRYVGVRNLGRLSVDDSFFLVKQVMLVFQILVKMVDPAFLMNLLDRFDVIVHRGIQVVPVIWVVQ